MKVNNKPIFTIVTHKNILVEQLLKGLQAPEYVPVYKDFNYEALIGIAHIKLKCDKVYADINLLADIKGFPAIAYKDHNNEIYALAICAKPNIDNKIKSL